MRAKGRATKATRKRPEEAQQIAFFEWLKQAEKEHPGLALAFAVPNERKCSIQRRISMRKAGVKSGIPDIMIPLPNERYHGLFIEMKVKPNKATPEQKVMLHALALAGYYSVICWSAEEAIEVTSDYLKNKK